MKDEIYVYNCPYVKQVAKETIWDFSTSEIYPSSSFRMGIASKSTRHRLAGTYRVITADNTAMSIELREDKALVVHTDKGPCEGTWSIGLGASERYLTYTKDVIVCSININCQLIRQRYRCVFERDGVMILIPMKNITTMKKILDSWPHYDKRNYDYSSCLFLVREQEGENRPQTVEQFTSYVKDVYLGEVLDRKIAGTMKENFERRGLVVLLYILLVVLYPVLCIGSILLLLPVLNSLISGTLFIASLTAILIWSLYRIIGLEAQFKDRQISEEKSYAKRFKETHEAYEIPNVSYQWTFNNDWKGR